MLEHPALLFPSGRTGDHISVFPRRDRWFESISLQRTVRLSHRSAFEAREPGLFARLWAAGLAPGAPETRKVFRDRANRRQYRQRRRLQVPSHQFDQIVAAAD